MITKSLWKLVQSMIFEEGRFKKYYFPDNEMALYMVIMIPFFLFTIVADVLISPFEIIYYISLDLIIGIRKGKKQ